MSSKSTVDRTISKFEAFPVDPDETVRAARDRFLATYGLDTDGYVDPEFPIHLGPVVLKMRNPGLLPYHDLHHVATGFPSGVVGEAEISAFELRAGWGSPLIFVLCIGAIACGMVMSPRRVVRAWLLSKGAMGLYGTRVEYDALLSMTVAELRSCMRVPVDGIGRPAEDEVMSNEQPWVITPIEPFGIVVRSTVPGADVMSIGTSQIGDWIAQHRIAVLRNFAAPEGDRLTEFGRSLGEVAEWDFGAVNDLKVKPDSKNYLYTPAAVPFHWDGAFVGKIPHYITFHCEEAPPVDAGGETLFTDAIRLVSEAPQEKQELWARTSITYSTEKVVHYGGSFTSPMLGKHPNTGETVLRYAEPVEDLNPVRLDIHGVESADTAAFIADLNARLNDPALCLAHVWEVGDIVIADNHALLHGRRAFKKSAPRHIRRVNVL